MTMTPARPPLSAADTARLAEVATAAGLYCAEAVVKALATAQGIDSELVPRIATAFCGGLSRTCGPCGALTGAVMGLGLSLGRDNAQQSADAVHTATRTLV